MYHLTLTQKQYLSENGFVIVPSAEFASIAEAYETLKDRDRAIFITTDALLHTAHLFFDYILRIVEFTALRLQLVRLTEALLSASATDFAQATDSGVREAARCNLAFFSVGANLLDPACVTPAEVADLVQAELDLIQAHAAEVPPPKSPTVGIREDYTQYIPRGHYTRNDDFRTYFLAAMWYGRMGFFLYPSESHDLSQSDTERLVRQALLITRCLYSERIGQQAAVDVWRGIYETTALFAGRAEDPGPAEYQTLAQTVLGGLPGLEQLADDTLVDAFLTKARDLSRPKVLSTYYLSASQPDGIAPRWQDGTLGFHFMPQRFVPDTHIFSELVWDRVGSFVGEGEPFTLFVSLYDGPYRGVPRGLDVLAAFGSDLAEHILQDEGDAAYLGYQEKLSELRTLYAREDLGHDLYHRWLDVLRILLETPPKVVPRFMRNEAWGGKQCNAALGSWAELRHDTILYIKQSYTSTARGAALPPPHARAHVEPCPRVYRGLGGMMAHMRKELEIWGTVESVVHDKVLDFEALLDELATVAEKELQGRWPDESQMNQLAAIGRRLKGLLAFPPELVAQIASGADDRMAMVADVHTHLEGGKVLEEAVGDPYLIYVEMEHEGRRDLYCGAVFSYYEFKHPMDDRLTDEMWQAMSPKPPLPPWTGMYVAED